MVGFFHLITNKRNLSPTLQRSRRMSCRPNPSPDSAKVWLLPLPFDLFLHTKYISFYPRFIYVFRPRFSFLFLRVYFSHIHNTTASFSYSQFFLLFTTSLFAFCFVSPFPLCSAPTPTFTYTCARNHSRQTNNNSQWHICFKYMSNLNLLVRSIAFLFS